jgi:hypothetical protein
MKLPHWAQLAVAATIVLLTWLQHQAATGAVSLPAAAVTALTVVLTVLGLLTPSTSDAANARAVLSARAGTDAVTKAANAVKP